MYKKFDRLCISFSGGRTSAYMAMRLLKECRDKWSEIVVVFANTGQEHPKTLDYVHACDKHYGFDLVWLEAEVDFRVGKGTSFRRTDYANASRDGRPFEDVIKKYGLPGVKAMHCTRETKLQPIQSYLKSLGWAEYNTAIGVRYDEMDRISPKAVSSGAVYPLIQWRVTKQDVLGWELREPVRLGIPEHYGNCVWCWKKSFRKLGTVALEMPEAFEFPRKMERLYPDAGRKSGLDTGAMFRGCKVTADIFELARDPSFKPFVDGFQYGDSELDRGAACGDSCEIGTDDWSEVLD